MVTLSSPVRAGLASDQVVRQAAFPWMNVMLLTYSVATLAALFAQTLLRGDVQKVLLVVAGVAVLFFGLLAAGDLRWWAQIRKLARASRPG